jgi:hypothetical protein
MVLNKNTLEARVKDIGVLKGLAARFRSDGQVPSNINWKEMESRSLAQVRMVLGDGDDHADRDDDDDDTADDNRDGGGGGDGGSSPGSNKKRPRKGIATPRSKKLKLLHSPA